MVNYNNSKIYKITSANTDKIFISSTTQKLCSRMASHRRSLTPASTEYQVMKYPDAHIVLIEAFSCNSKDELTARELRYKKKYSTICINGIETDNNAEDSFKNDKFEVKLIDGDYYITVFASAVAENNPRIIYSVKPKPAEMPLEAI